MGVALEAGQHAVDLLRPGLANGQNRHLAGVVKAALRQGLAHRRLADAMRHRPVPVHDLVVARAAVGQVLVLLQVGPQRHEGAALVVLAKRSALPGVPVAGR